jgi:hypothetical protein
MMAWGRRNLPTISICRMTNSERNALAQGTRKSWGFAIGRILFPRNSGGASRAGAPKETTEKLTLP